MGKALGGWSRCADVVSAFPENAAALRDTTVIVTGCNTGIGKQTAATLARLGARVVFACRSLEKAEAAALEITNAAARDGEAEATPKALQITCLKLDLLSLASVRAFAREFSQRIAREGWGPLKALVLNAGICKLDGYSASADGHEATFQSNHLAHFLLTRLLLPHLQAGAPSRVVVVSSHSHYGPHSTRQVASKEALRARVADPPAASFWSPWLLNAYGSSKLCNVLFAQELHARQLAASSGVTACSLHPGTLMLTEVTRGSPLIQGLQRRLLAWFTKDMDQGAATSIYCTLLDAPALQGRYFADCTEWAPSRLAQGEGGQAARTALWELSEELVAAHCE